MSNNREFLTTEQAIAMLPEGEYVHTFLPGGPVLCGADWTREEALDLINSGVVCELAGEAATSMGHGLVVWRGKQPVFMATKKGD